jgi:4-oxalocrotonate tautomerase
MPFISIEGPKLEDINVKRRLVKGLTEITAQVYQLPEQAIQVLIKENLPENVGIGGELIVDRRKSET